MAPRPVRRCEIASRGAALDLFDRLKSAAAEAWDAYVDHPFVRRLRDGTLPEAAFRAYLVQDYLFLVQFARAYALAAYKSRTLPEIEAAQAILAAILNETKLHVRLCTQRGIADLATVPEHPATVAYTRFVLDLGAAGDLLDLHVALSPCVIGYAEIGRALAPAAMLGDHPYREWIAEYASEPYQALAVTARRHLDDLAARALTERRFPDLVVSFAAASRLEADFWQMGLDAAGERR